MTPEVEALIDAVLELGLFCEDQRIELRSGKINLLDEINHAITAIMLVEHQKMMSDEQPTVH